MVLIFGLCMFNKSSSDALWSINVNLGLLKANAEFVLVVGVGTVRLSSGFGNFKYVELELKLCHTQDIR